MLDIQFIREHPDVVRESQHKRGESVELVDEVLALDNLRRQSLQKYENARAKQKEIGKRVASASDEEKTALLAEVKQLSSDVASYKSDADKAEQDYMAAAWKLSNIVEPEAPAGGEDDYIVRELVGTPRDFVAEGFTPRDHVELGEMCGGLDIARGAKVGGSRFYFMKRDLARLEMALYSMAIDYATKKGFILTITPTLVRPEIMAGTGFLNQHSDEIYRLREPDTSYLVGTSEVSLAGMHADEILDLSNGPLKYCGWSACYRREAGAAGKDTRGIIRVHQFYKVEMFVYCKQEDARAMHQELLGIEKEMLQRVEVPFRVIDTAAGDLGSSASRKFDCEAWVPTQNKYRELTSTSNCDEYQARRLRERYRTGEGDVVSCATLNGTLATTRWLVAIIENHQQKDGSITIPEALRPYMGGQSIISPLPDTKA